MDNDTFITVVMQQANMGREKAERATRAVLQTLGERIAKGEAADLAAELPPELAPFIATTTDAERFDREEFVRRVARRLDSDHETAERYAGAVFEALARAVSENEWEDLVAELPKDFAPLLARGPWVQLMSAETFAERVLERAPVDEEEAKKAIFAVLETLAERIAGGEVDDLKARLPGALHPPLDRGKEHFGGKARRMSFAEFQQRVAERMGADDDEVVLACIRAVFRTLREAVGDDEWFDVTVQLPRDFPVAR
ncbi:MAG: hypothetical protein JWO02_1223 [Solirubrobacterales bacterium]|nr:hypothetical protein [Solirubrobacterales bacterium]